MSRSTRAALAAAVAGGALAIGLAGCGGSSSASSGSSSSASSGSSGAVATVPGNAIARAADVSAKESGYAFTMSLQEGVASLGGTITGSGQGTFNVPAHAGQLALSLALPGVAAVAGNLAIHEIFKGQNVYLELPALFASRLPGGKSWIELNLNAIGHAAGLSGLSSLTGSAAGSSNPAQFLQYLQAASASGIKDVGPATVDGVSTTHYQGTVDLDKASALAPAAQRKSVAQAIAQLQKLSGLTKLPVNVYVDSKNLVRRLQFDYTANVKGQSASTNLQIDFTSYGAQPVPTPPPAGDITNLDSLLGSLSGLAGAA